MSSVDGVEMTDGVTFSSPEVGKAEDGNAGPGPALGDHRRTASSNSNFLSFRRQRGQQGIYRPAGAPKHRTEIRRSRWALCSRHAHKAIRRVLPTGQVKYMAQYYVEHGSNFQLFVAFCSVLVSVITIWVSPDRHRSHWVTSYHFGLCESLSLTSCLPALVLARG